MIAEAHIFSRFIKSHLLERVFDNEGQCTVVCNNMVDVLRIRQLSEQSGGRSHVLWWHSSCCDQRRNRYEWRSLR